MEKYANFYDVIHDRRSVRNYDTSVKVPDEEIKELIGEAILAPNAHNLNTWRFMVFTDPILKERLHKIALGQRQVLEAPAVVALLGDMNAYSVENSDRINQKAVDAGYMTEEAKEKINNSMDDFSGHVSEQVKREWLMIDSGLAAMQFMLAAKARGYDTVPMIGYNVEEFRKEFNIPENLVNVLMIAIGKAKKPGYTSVRLGVDEVTYWNGKL
ncbi:nitroreductase family protein [Paenibacillus sp. CGMCC 1.16610]|uniref:Nitroreductase family protein n=1 Tax=Paenibacillus anseongense TaxID=2682845 RepID=A0ABW9UFD8_9BACL|nr:MULTISPECIES: nitroreductase family protein [Paenibacillus]MBA2944187.1 nitroreductase family protein [Paenibacillus sp. CGMCC 1.16610]MVQ38077.1 nitroreductase family protein [Paenibacillus anseongense]